VSGVPVIRIRDLLTSRTETFFDGRIPDGVAVADGDLLIGMDGDFNVVIWRGGHAVMNQRVCCLRAHQVGSQGFLNYALPVLCKSLNDETSSTTVKHLSSLDLLRSQIPFPPEHDQHRIADFLDAQTTELDRSVNANLRLQARLNERRETITALGVSGRMIGLTTSKSRLPWLEALPSAWPVIKLTLIARLGSGHTPSRHHPEWWQEATIPWVTTGEVQQMRQDRIEYVFETRERISELGLAHSSAELHPAGTVVLCRTASAGFSAIMGVPMATSQDFVTWSCGPLLRPRYLLLCLRAMRQDLLGRLAMGSTHQTIYVSDIESIRVPLPPVAQQDQIVENTWSKLKETDQLIDHLAHQIELLHERREALITAAVTGQISVPAVASA
jgi:type I restriction enzyme, S subunit